jgi:hypothetical protein
MVFYSSMSPLPSLASILCSLLHRLASMLYSFSSCAQQSLMFNLLSSFYSLWFFFMLFTAPWISPSYYALCLILPTCITLEKTHSVICSACLSHANFSARSSSQLFVFSGGYSKLFIISGRYPKITCLL